jgi:hypothetical protein
MKESMMTAGGWLVLAVVALVTFVWISCKPQKKDNDDVNEDWLDQFKF